MHNAEIMHEAARLRGEILRLYIGRLWSEALGWVKRSPAR